MDVSNFLSYIASGTLYTLGASLIALPAGLILGLVFALLYLYGGKVLSNVMAVYSTVMRGIPPIVLLFVLYFVVSGSVNLSPFLAGSISLGIISSAYQMEIIRGAIQCVSGGQLMAARAIGLSQSQAVREILLPQALRIALPSWSNEAAIVIKDSSLIYALGVPEILRRAQLISASTQQPFLAYSAAALIYFALVFITTRLLGRLEQKLAIPANP
ncbi:MAG TPA: amino acid ABC transporter permease [Anaerolineaceae bacterium]|nr:amino acid ABC transporter permease [Anaerolineaceae bacterium]